MLTNASGGGAAVVLGAVVIFLLTFFLLKNPLPFLPRDHGRAYAVDGELSKGKLRGVGVVFIPVFILGSLAFLPFDMEYAAYMALLFFMMLFGYLDDAAKLPWSDYKKGALDFLLSLLTMATFVYFNPTVVSVGSAVIALPKAVYFILGVILLWGSVNVTNCADGVDGLCGSVSALVFAAFALGVPQAAEGYALYRDAGVLLIAALLAYLLFNAKPSSMLMGDAGSRAIGYMIAVVAMKSGHPFLFLPFALVFILDGGLGLAKIFLKRFFKISIFVNTRMPLHDHFRKQRGWSDTQIVLRYCALQIFFSALGYLTVTLL